MHALLTYLELHYELMLLSSRKLSGIPFNVLTLLSEMENYARDVD